MNSVETLYKIWVYLQTEPLFWLTVTIGAFLTGDYLYKKSKINPLVNPVAISILIVSGILIIFDIDYERYFNGAQFIHFLLGPATVALAIPIYNQIKLIQKEAISISITLVTGSLFAVFITYYLAKSFGLDEKLILSMLPRSVTAPIAMGISELINGLPSLTAIITIATGIIGASLSTFVLDFMKVKDMTARGFAIGLTSHGIGTARAMSRNKTAGIFSALALALSGVAASIIIPLVIKFFY
jgi:predicted murein hydrolase (TIGR00659 family)